MAYGEVQRDPVHGARYRFEPRGDDVRVECWLEPGGALPPHLHPVQEERWWVIDGEVEFRLGADRRTIRADDGVQLVRPHVVHGLRNRGDREAHLGCDVSPALGLEAFLTESAQAARDGLFRKGGIPTSPRGLRWAASFLARHRRDVVMSFPPRFAQRAMVALFADADSKRSAREAA
ncbi:cupin domain-containing protein [Thermoleophilia bacterium SCSIO 60948]|nr:cupin domain-containing protein [Thermoleophilia bacterium SCSIO 60948]